MVISNEEMTSSLSYLSVLALILDEMAPLCIQNEADNRPFVQASIPLTCFWISHPSTSPYMDQIQSKWLCRGKSQLYYHWKEITLLISDQVKHSLSMYWTCNCYSKEPYQNTRSQNAIDQYTLAEGRIIGSCGGNVGLRMQSLKVWQERRMIPQNMAWSLWEKSMPKLRHIIILL